MKNNLTTTNKNAKLALIKSKSLLNITNSLLSKKVNSDLTKNFQFKPYFSDGHFDSIKSLAITPDGNTIVSGSQDKTIKLWNINTGSCVNTLKGHIGSVKSLAITPDGNTIVSGSQDKTIKLWDIRSGKCIKTIEGHDNEINSMAVTDDGEYLVSGGSDICEEFIRDGEIININRYSEIKIWEIESGKYINTFEQHTTRDSSIIALISDCDLIFAGSADGTIDLFSLHTGEYIQPFASNYYSGNMHSLIITPDKRTIIACDSHKNIQLWDVFNNKYIKSLIGHADSVKSLAITPNGNTIVSGSQDKTIKLWDIRSGVCVNTLENHTEKISKLENGTCIYTINDGSTITMFSDGSFNASEDNIDKFIRVNDIPLSCRKLTKEEIEHFCKVKYDNKVDNEKEIPFIDIDEDEIPF